MLVVDRLKRLLLHYNLLTVYAKSMVDNAVSRMQLYYGCTGKKKKKRFLLAKIDFERYSIYLEEITRQRDELLSNIELVMSKHNKRFEKIFVAYYVEGKSKEIIADELDYSLEAVNKIIYEISDELIKAYKK